LELQHAHQGPGLQQAAGAVDLTAAAAAGGGGGGKPAAGLNDSFEDMQHAWGSALDAEGQAAADDDFPALDDADVGLAGVLAAAAAAAAAAALMMMMMTMFLQSLLLQMIRACCMLCRSCTPGKQQLQQTDPRHRTLLLVVMNSNQQGTQLPRMRQQAFQCILGKTLSVLLLLVLL